MSYATPTQFIERFGLRETAQLLADEQRLLTAALLVVAVGGAAYPEGTSADQATATNSGLQRLQTALETVSNLMDGYMRSVVSLPLSADNANAGVLRDCCMALTRCSLADDADNFTDRMQALADQWTKWLEDVSKGRIKLVLADASQAQDSYRVRHGKAKSSFDWGHHGGGRA